MHGCGLMFIFFPWPWLQMMDLLFAENSKYRIWKQVFNIYRRHWKQSFTDIGWQNMMFVLRVSWDQLDSETWSLLKISGCIPFFSWVTLCCSRARPFVRDRHTTERYHLHIDTAAHTTDTHRHTQKYKQRCADRWKTQGAWSREFKFGVQEMCFYFFHNETHW